MLKQIGISTNEIYLYDSLKVTVLNRSTKEAKISSFHSLPSAESEQKWNT